MTKRQEVNGGGDVSGSDSTSAKSLQSDLKVVCLQYWLAKVAVTDIWNNVHLSPVAINGT